MRTYELMVILDGDLADAELSQVRSDVRSRLEEVSTIIYDEFEGNKRFAYEINHKTHGHYMILEVTATPGALDPVERALLIADEIVRHKVIRLPDFEAARRITARAAAEAAPEPEAEPASETAAAAETSSQPDPPSEAPSAETQASTTADPETAAATETAQTETTEPEAEEPTEAEAEPAPASSAE